MTNDEINKELERLGYDHECGCANCAEVVFIAKHFANFAAIAEQEQCEPVEHNFKSPQQRDYEMMQAISKASHPAPVPAGWRLVPVEPTSEMMLAAEKQAWIDAGLLRPMQPLDSNTWHSTALNRYKAMLQAAPKPGDTHD